MTGFDILTLLQGLSPLALIGIIYARDRQKLAEVDVKVAQKADKAYVDKEMDDMAKATAEGFSRIEREVPDKVELAVYKAMERKAVR